MSHKTDRFNKTVKHSIKAVKFTYVTLIEQSSIGKTKSDGFLRVIVRIIIA